jgi:hypothetical protein
MLKLTEVDGSKLLYDIHSKTFVDDIKKGIPEFDAYTGEMEKKVFQYVVMMYDVKTPMRVECPDYFQRKYMTASMVGLPKNKQGFTEASENILIGRDKEVNALVVAYVFQFAMPEFSALVAYEAILASEMQKVMKGSNTKDSGKVVDDATKKIQELTRSVFRSGDYDENTELRNALYARIEKEKTRLRPEQVIRDMENNGGILDDSWCPYGEGEAEAVRNIKISFKGDGKV